MSENLRQLGQLHFFQTLVGHQWIIINHRRPIFGDTSNWIQLVHLAGWCLLMCVHTVRSSSHKSHVPNDRHETSRLRFRTLSVASEVMERMVMLSTKRTKETSWNSPQDRQILAFLAWSRHSTSSLQQSLLQSQQRELLASTFTVLCLMFALGRRTPRLHPSWLHEVISLKFQRGEITARSKTP